MWAPYKAVDREAIWAALFTHFKSKLWALPWQAGATITTGDVVTDRYGHLQKAQNDGTTGTDAPAFSQSGGTITDNPGVNQVVWLDTGAGVVSIGRKHKHPPALGVAEQPALFLVQVQQNYAPKPFPGVPTRLTLSGYLILYLLSDAPTEDVGEEQLLAATQLNQLFYAIDSALLPDSTNGKFTIGNLVEHCWIEGDTREDPGILGNQAAVIMPIHILVP
ncbi:MAG: hypothetical protein JST28_09105 [Acidobacteria bacterium]|nr:hypothetical protein [Acidobacteriota bacterium]